MTSERHHFIPELLLRRFSIDPGREHPLIWVLDKETGETRQLSTRHLTAVTDYNRLFESLGVHARYVEERLDREVERPAGSAIGRLVRKGHPSEADREALAKFVVVQHYRTPRERQQMVDIWCRIALLHMASNPNFARKILERGGRSPEAHEVEAWRREQSRRLTSSDSGPLIKDPADSEVIAQLLPLTAGIQEIVSRMAWVGLRAPAGAEFVLSDHPVVHYDPAAGNDEPVKWAWTNTLEVTLPLDPKLCLLMIAPLPGPFPFGRQPYIDQFASLERVEEINLRTYASGQWEIIGPNEDLLKSVHETAAQSPDAVARYAPRAPRLFVAHRYEWESRPFEVLDYTGLIQARRPKGRKSGKSQG